MNAKLVGVDIGGTRIKVAAFTLDGIEIGHWFRDSEDHPAKGLPRFAETVRQILCEIASDDALVGISSPGLVAKDNRSIAYQPGKLQGLEGLDWTNLLQRHRVVPVLNDAHAALLGEVWAGAAAGLQDVILLTLGTGVGGAIMCDGKLLRGHLGRAGHLGHISLAPKGEKSIFGIPGALECAIGNYNVKTRTGGRFNSTRELVEAHLLGDQAATKVWIESVHNLAQAITSFISVLDPEAVIVGGGIAQAGPALFEPLARFLDDMEWRPAGNRVRVIPAALGAWAGAYGAAWNALKSFQANEILTSRI